MAVPVAPTDLTATPGNGQVVLSWTAPAGTLTSYDYALGAIWYEIPDSDGTEATYTVTGLDNGTEYSFNIRAVNSDGDGADAGSVKATPRTTPDAPTLEAIAGNGCVFLRWIGGDGGAKITATQYRESVGSWQDIVRRSGVLKVPADAEYIAGWYRIKGLTNDTEMTYNVRRQNAAGWSDASNTVTVTPRWWLADPQGPANAVWALNQAIQGTNSEQAESRKWLVEQMYRDPNTSEGQRHDDIMDMTPDTGPYFKNLLDSTRTMVDRHAPDAPVPIKREALVRLAGYLFDTQSEREGGRNAMVSSGVGSLLLPWRVHRLGKCEVQ